MCRHPGRICFHVFNKNHMKYQTYVKNWKNAVGRILFATPEMGIGMGGGNYVYELNTIFLEMAHTRFSPLFEKQHISPWPALKITISIISKNSSYNIFFKSQHFKLRMFNFPPKQFQYIYIYISIYIYILLYIGRVTWWKQGPMYRSHKHSKQTAVKRPWSQRA